MANKATATYVYCAVQSARRPRVAKGAPVMPEASPARVLDAEDGVWLVVADAPLEAYGAEAIERGLRDMGWVSRCATAHEAIVEQMGAAGTVLPMKLFTLFTNDARALAHVKKIRRRMEETFERVKGCDEWGVRIRFDEVEASRAAAAKARSVPREGLSGASFLQLKKQQHDASHTRLRDAREEVEAVYEALAEASAESFRRPPVQQDLAGRVLLDAVFLVPRKKAAKFRGVAARAAEDLGARGYDVTLSGPWPAYHFIAGAA
jgi:hypothetical protein